MQRPICTVRCQFDVQPAKLWENLAAHLDGMPGLGRQTRNFLFRGLVRTHKNTQGLRRSDPTDPSKRRRRHGSVFLGDVRGMFSLATPMPPLSGCREQIPPISRMSYFGSCFAKKIPTATEMVTKRLVDYYCYKSCNLMGNLSEQIFPTPGSTRERRNRHDMSFICFPSHVIRSCSLKPLQVCVPSGVKQTIVAQFFFLF